MCSVFGLKTKTVLADLWHDMEIDKLLWKGQISLLSVLCEKYNLIGRVETGYRHHSV
jgi:hypothetical protein